MSSKSSAVKRLMKEYADLQKDPCPEFTAAPLNDDLFEWHFTIRGPPEGGFAGGRYHGRIIFPADYPFKPPNISFLTPNGRFEVGKKICLSITGYHPEYWRPAWGVRLALVAIISFFPTKGDGAIGSLDYTEEERKLYAKRSRKWQCPTCGNGKKNEDLLPDESEQPTQKLEVDPEIVLSVKDQDNTSEAQNNNSASDATEQNFKDEAVSKPITISAVTPVESVNEQPSSSTLRQRTTQNVRTDHSPLPREETTRPSPQTTVIQRHHIDFAILLVLFLLGALLLRRISGASPLIS